MGDGVFGEDSVTLEGGGLGEVLARMGGVSVSAGRDRL